MCNEVRIMKGNKRLIKQEGAERKGEGEREREREKDEEERGT